MKDFKRFVSYYLKKVALKFNEPEATMDEIFPPRANFEEICSILDKEWRRLKKDAETNGKEDPLMALLERERELLWLRWFRLGSDKGIGTRIGAEVRIFFRRIQQELR